MKVSVLKEVRLMTEPETEKTEEETETKPTIPWQQTVGASVLTFVVTALLAQGASKLSGLIGEQIKTNVFHIKKEN